MYPSRRRGRELQGDLRILYRRNHLVTGIGPFQARRLARRRDTTDRIRRGSRRRLPLGAARRYEVCIKFFTQTLREVVISRFSQ